MNDFIGSRIAFPFQLGDRNHIALASGDLAIRQSIYVIVYTVPGERVMRPDFGCEIHSLIFDPINDETAVVAERYVREAILLWEPRIDLKAVTVKPGDSDLGEMWIDITYQIKGYYEPRSLVIPFYLIP
ncbi:MAG: GPW/gp25 family protein [Chloroflexota bacterium]|nr:GPW/gp25 family protein [Chloroflexota bacterium]